MLMGYVDRMESMGAPKKGKVYHLKYQMTTIFNEKNGTHSEVADVEVFTSHDKIAVYDKKMNVFGDDENIFVILPDVKKIYWNNSDPKIFDEVATYGKFLDIQRALLNSASNITCSEKEGGLMSITIAPSSDFTKRTGLKHQKITYSLKEDRIIKVENEFKSYSRIKNQIMTYQKLDFDSSEKIVSPIEALFNGNKLKSVYNGFEIIDNRKKH